MPLYEYQCDRCCGRFTLLQAMSAPREGHRCPHCGKRKTHRVMSSFATNGRVAGDSSGCGPGAGPFR